MAIFAHVPKRSKGEVCNTSRLKGPRKFDSYRALEMLNSKGDDMSASLNDVNAVKAAVADKMAKLLKTVDSKDTTLPKKDVLNSVCDIFQGAAASVGAKLWRVWDRYNTEKVYTVTVEIFFGNDKVSLEYVAQ